MINKGKLTTAGQIDLDDGVTLTADVHTLYYVVEGATSGKFTVGGRGSVQCIEGSCSGCACLYGGYSCDGYDDPVTKTSGPDASADLVRTFHVE